MIPDTLTSICSQCRPPASRSRLLLCASVKANLTFSVLLCLILTLSCYTVSLSLFSLVSTSLPFITRHLPSLSSSSLNSPPFIFSSILFFAVTYPNFISPTLWHPFICDRCSLVICSFVSDCSPSRSPGAHPYLQFLLLSWFYAQLYHCSLCFPLHKPPPALLHVLVYTTLSSLHIT